MCVQMHVWARGGESETKIISLHIYFIYSVLNVAS